MSLPKLSDKDRNWYILKGYEIQEYSSVRFWYLNGLWHREDGPAYEHADGTRAWYLNGQLHREDQHREAVNEMKIQNALAI